jgi:C4-dicarboxylate-specific signal transduction histidine kinase
LGDSRNEEIPNAIRNLSKDKSKLFLKNQHYKKVRIPFFVNINICHAEYGGGHVLLATTTDISESIEKEAQLIQASKMTTLGTMAAGMAHEINQPLNVIQVCADFFLKMIKKGNSISDEDLKSMAGDISNNVQRASEIIKHMRDFARQSEVVKTKVNINEPIKDVFKVLGHQLKVHQIELKLDLAPELPYIMADHNRLEQVFINLVTNAVDAMDKKGDELGDIGWKRLLKIKSFSENGQAVVTVTDTGTGIPKEIIDKIFEPFFTTKEVGKGTGLGVSISYGIVKDYNGTIEIKSEVGKGTTFELRFPVSE